jgi:putative two-component system response regulator
MLNTTHFLNASILIVDDLPVNVHLLSQILSSAGYTALSSTTNPHVVCDLHRKNHYDLILLDLQMPGLNGYQVMDGLKEIEQGGYLPVLVVTAQPEEKLHALKAGAKDFISKPFELSEVLARVHNMLEVRLLHKELNDYNALLEQRVKERTADLLEGNLETIFTMTRAAEFKNEDTGEHVQRISYYSRELAQRLGLHETFVDRIFVASPMHDIGKIGIPDHILLKPGGFNAEEWKVMMSHAEMGAKILGNIKSLYLMMAAEIALNHHERWDGSGYPNAKRGEAIPLSARIMNICDIYDALRSKRPYKPAFDHQKAMNILLYGDGRTDKKNFDPIIYTVFTQNHKAFQDIFESFAAKPSIE